MTASTCEERQWLLRMIAAGLHEYLSTTDPPVMVEDLLMHPPEVYADDFGIVDIFSQIWDASFVRPMNRKGSVFVRVDLPQEARNFALARETLLALLSGKFGRKLGLHDVLLPYISDSADYFAMALLAPEALVKSYSSRNGTREAFAGDFCLPEKAAAVRWNEVAGE